MDKQNIDKSNKTDQISKAGQPSKAVRFPKQRLQIVKNILNTIGITKDNNILILKSMDTDIQEKILNMENDIRRYFNAGGWHVFKKGVEVDRPCVSIIKRIMKEMNIEVIHYNKYNKNEILSCYLFNFDDNSLFE